jgi:hypothetical protein
MKKQIASRARGHRREEFNRNNDKARNKTYAEIKTWGDT